MFWLLFFPTLLAFASTCTGLIKDPRCESSRVLELNSFTLYATSGKEIDVLPRHENGTELQWKVQRGYGKFVKQSYRRLVIINISQFAGAYAWYDLVRNGTTVYTSALVYALQGSHPGLTLNIPPVVAIEYGESYRVCFEYSGSPLPEIYLHKIVSGDIVLRVSNSCLEVHSADYGATSAYILEAHNCFGSATKSFRIKVMEKPKIAIHFDNATGNLSEESSLSIKVNGNLTLPYTVRGDPHPSVEWFHNNSMLDDSKYNASHLTLHDVKPSDAGTYVVVARSVYGQTNRSFWLSVRGKDSIHSLDATSSDTSVTPSQSSTSDTPILFTTDATQKPATPQQLNCDEENPDDSCDDTSEFPWWIVGVVVCATVALGVVIIVVVVICCCRKDKGDNKDPEKTDSLKEELKPNGTTEKEVVLSDSKSSVKIHFEAVVAERDDNYDHIPCGDLYSTLSADGGVGHNKPASDPDIPLYSSVDKDSKKQDPSADYSNIDKEKEENTLRYADLDKETMEETLPPRPRYEAVEYSEINSIQPGPRQE